MATLTVATKRSGDHERAAHSARRAIEVVLADGQVRLDAELARLRKLGVIDEKGHRISKEVPPDMKPGADRDFGG